MGELSGIARLLIGIGIALVVIGFLLYILDRVPGFSLGRLPGDIYIKKPGFTLYIPITTMLLVSLILTVLAGIFRR